MWLHIYSHLHMIDISHLKKYLRQKVWLVYNEGKESGYNGKNTGQNERISRLIVYNHLQQLHTLIYGNFLQQWEEQKKHISVTRYLFKSLTAVTWENLVVLPPFQEFWRAVQTHFLWRKSWHPTEPLTETEQNRNFCLNYCSMNEWTYYLQTMGVKLKSLNINHNTRTISIIPQVMLGVRHTLKHTGVLLHNLRNKKLWFHISDFINLMQWWQTASDGLQSFDIDAKLRAYHHHLTLNTLHQFVNSNAYWLKAINQKLYYTSIFMISFGHFD